ncbi:MAG: AmmeMemoRadiSam system protein B [Vampirovibrionia bacterium]
MTLEQVVLFPHPPIVVPEVAGSRFNEIKVTADAMEKLSKDVLAKNPDTIVIITPHSQLHSSAFATYVAPQLSGNFAGFGAPQVRMTVKNDLELIQTIQNIRIESGIKDMVPMNEKTPIDHGSAVPLYYLLKEGYQGAVVIFNYCFGTKEQHKDFGNSIKQAAERLNKKVILVASGDLSHRVTESAPGGFAAEGKQFDQMVYESIKTGKYENISSMDPQLRENAGECAYNSLMVAFGALENMQTSSEIYSYEAPFGVGYLVASL